VCKGGEGEGGRKEGGREGGGEEEGGGGGGGGGGGEKEVVVVEEEEKEEEGGRAPRILKDRQGPGRRRVEGVILILFIVPTRGKSWGDGTYSVSFTPAFVGDYEISVKFDGNPIILPWKFSVVPAVPDVTQTKVEGFPTSGILHYLLPSSCCSPPPSLSLLLLPSLPLLPSPRPLCPLCPSAPIFALPPPLCLSTPPLGPLFYPSILLPPNFLVHIGPNKFSILTFDRYLNACEKGGEYFQVIITGN
jgi:hypothetical protein